MSELEINSHVSTTSRLAADGFWAAQAMERLTEGKYSDVIRICREHFETSPKLVSGRLAYATALYLSGQVELATDEFHHVLALDPDNQVALKYLGDIRFASGDAAEAMAYYRRILEIDPGCRGLKSTLKKRPTGTTRTITLSRGSEPRPISTKPPLREIQFYTETMGDLYMKQGHPRLAAEIYRRLNERGTAPRLAEKLVQAESKIKERES
ncbi:MAG: tetratricopeptide repeat protein [candidate division Zixibacteria bacterium]|nr:tetratricopeptide repeat protein [candidate division Zixibacteria bacterium]